MNRRMFFTLVGSATTSALLMSNASLAAPEESPLGQTHIIVQATKAFLGLLTPEQREQVQFTFSAQPSATAAHFKGGLGGNITFTGEQYGQAMWSNFPVSDVPRPGLRLGGLSNDQRDAAMHVLATLLSPMGYQKVLDIMGSDQALADSGTNFAAGRDVYTIGIFGVPDVTFALDGAVRRPPSRAQHNDDWRARRSRAGADRRAAGRLCGRRKKPYAHSGARTTRPLSCSNRSTQRSSGRPSSTMMYPSWCLVPATTRKRLRLQA